MLLRSGTVSICIVCYLRLRFRSGALPPVNFVVVQRARRLARVCGPTLPKRRGLALYGGGKPVRRDASEIWVAARRRTHNAAMQLHYMRTIVCRHKDLHPHELEQLARSLPRLRSEREGNPVRCPPSVRARDGDRQCLRAQWFASGKWRRPELCPDCVGRRRHLFQRSGSRETSCYKLRDKLL